MADSALAKAQTQIAQAQKGVPAIKACFDEPTFTFSYIVHDAETKHAAVIDSVLDYDPASGRTSPASTEMITAYVQGHHLVVDRHLETHAHAGHLPPPEDNGISYLKIPVNAI